MHFFRLATRILDLAILGSGSTTFQTKISYIKYPKQDGIASCLDMIIILINSISSKNWPQYPKGWLLWTMRVLLDNTCLCSYVCSVYIIQGCWFFPPSTISTADFSSPFCCFIWRVWVLARNAAMMRQHRGVTPLAQNFFWILNKIG